MWCPAAVLRINAEHCGVLRALRVVHVVFGETPNMAQLGLVHIQVNRDLAAT